MKTARGKWPVIAVAVFAAAVAVFATARFVSFYLWSERMGGELNRLALSDARLPVTVTVYGRSVDTVSARAEFQTVDGDLAGTLERSWSGWEIKMDCIEIKTGDGWIVFPFLMYTDATPPGSGIDLIRYYNRAGFPAIYDSPRLSPLERKALRRLFSVARTELWMPSAFGSLAHRTVGLKSVEPGTEYALYAGKDGTLQFKED